MLRASRAAQHYYSSSALWDSKIIFARSCTSEIKQPTKVDALKVNINEDKVRSCYSKTI